DLPPFELGAAAGTRALSLAPRGDAIDPLGPSSSAARRHGRQLRDDPQPLGSALRQPLAAAALSDDGDRCATRAGDRAAAPSRGAFRHRAMRRYFGTLGCWRGST